MNAKFVDTKFKQTCACLFTVKWVQEFFSNTNNFYNINQVLHVVNWFEILQYNSNKLIDRQSFLCTILFDTLHLNNSKYCLSSLLGLYNTQTAFLQRGKTPSECPGYDTKQPDEELWRIRSTPSLPLLPGPLWSGVVAPDRALSMG